MKSSMKFFAVAFFCAASLSFAKSDPSSTDTLSGEGEKKIADLVAEVLLKMKNVDGLAAAVADSTPAEISDITTPVQPLAERTESVAPSKSASAAAADLTLLAATHAEPLPAATTTQAALRGRPDSEVIQSMAKKLAEVQKAMQNLLVAQGAVGAPAAENKCTKNLSCTGCNADGDCQWCVGAVKDGSRQDYNMAKCTLATESCDKITFGTVSNLVDTPQTGLVHKRVDTSDPKCTDYPYPAEFWKYPDEDTCVNTPGYGWCSMEESVKVVFWWQSYSGGLCGRNEFLDFCNSDLVPDHKRTIDGWSVKLGLTSSKKLPPASETCSANRSCGNCLANANCTWCGGQFTGTGGEDAFPFGGRCVDSAANDACADVTYGDLTKLFPVEEVGPAFQAMTFPQKTNEMDWCLSMEWPTEFATYNTCKDCMAANLDTTAPKLGWCKLAITDLKGTRRSGGVCLNEALGPAACADFFVRDGIAVMTAHDFEEEKLLVDAQFVTSPESC